MSYQTAVFNCWACCHYGSLSWCQVQSIEVKSYSPSICTKPAWISSAEHKIGSQTETTELNGAHQLFGYWHS